MPASLLSWFSVKPIENSLLIDKTNQHVVGVQYMLSSQQVIC